MKRYLIIILSLITSYSFTQTYLVDQHFSNVAPAGWTSTSNVWNFARNESATGNYRNVYDATTYSARFSSAANGNSIYIYIPVNFVTGNTYTITFFIYLCIMVFSILLIKNNKYWTGIRHVYSNSINKYELLNTINEVYNLNLKISADLVERLQYWRI
mgnify:CR=1 FL=1